MRILSVDDDPAVLKIIKFFLSRKGYEVISTTNAREAVRMVEEERPDLVLLDVEMPEVSGLEIFDELKRRFEVCPVLFATGYPDSFRLDSGQNIRRYEEGFSDGMTDILHKPFQSGQIYEKVDALIGTPGAMAC